MLQNAPEKMVPLSEELPLEQTKETSSVGTTDTVLAITVQDGTSDFLGMSGSLLCLIHCLSPQLIALGLFGVGIGNFFAGESWALIFWLTCLWAVFRSVKNSVFPRAQLALWFAFGLFSLGLGLELFTESGKWLSYLGSLLLILSHLWNFRLQLRWRKFRLKCVS